MGAITHYIVKGTADDESVDVFIADTASFGWGTTTSRASAHEFLSEAEARRVRTELLGDGVVLRVLPDGTEEAVYGCVLGACHLHEGQGCELGHDPPTRCPWQRGQVPPPGAKANRREGLSMFCVFAPFVGMTGAILDLVGPWPKSLLSDPPEDVPARLRAPSWTGCAVWEGAAEREPDEQVGGWTLEGRWRKPSHVEMRRLADGRFPLRGEGLPESSGLVPFGTKETPC